MSPTNERTGGDGQARRTYCDWITKELTLLRYMMATIDPTSTLFYLAEYSTLRSRNDMLEEDPLDQFSVLLFQA